MDTLPSLTAQVVLLPSANLVDVCVPTWMTAACLFTAVSEPRSICAPMDPYELGHVDLVGDI